MCTPAFATRIEKAITQCQKQRNQFVAGDHVFGIDHTKKNPCVGNTHCFIQDNSAGKFSWSISQFSSYSLFFLSGCLVPLNIFREATVFLCYIDMEQDVCFIANPLKVSFYT